MNKRQKKKKDKIIKKRIEFFNGVYVYPARQNGKASIYKSIIKAVYSKRHRLFKILKNNIKYNKYHT